MKSKASPKRKQARHPSATRSLIPTENTKVTKAFDQLTLGHEIVARVERGLRHLRFQQLEAKVSVCDAQVTSDEEPDFLQRLGISSLQQARNLGFVGDTASEIRFLKARWRRVLGLPS